MRAKQVKSLLWLSRWYNGRSQRLATLHHAHLAALKELVLVELGGKSCRYRVPLELYGIAVVASCTLQGVEIHSIGAPQGYSGYQRKLFPHRLERTPRRVVRFKSQNRSKRPCS